MDRFKGLNIGMQSWTLRNFQLPDMVRIVKELGLNNLELGKLGVAGIGPEDPQKAMESVQYCRDQGLEINCLSLGFPDDSTEGDLRQRVELAQKLGMKILVGPPALSLLDTLDGLAREHDILIALHNHGPGGELSDIPTIEKILRPYERIGLCVDTGHYLRLPLDPLEVLKAFRSKIYAIHLRDMDPDQDPIKGDGSKYVEHVVGEGPLNLDGFLRLMLDWKYEGTIGLEYKPNADNPVPDMQRALANIEAALAKI